MFIKDPEKILIELTPYDALEILCFMNEFDLDHHPRLATIKKAVNNFEEQVCMRISDEDLEDACMQRKINSVLGTGPEESE